MKKYVVERYRESGNLNSKYRINRMHGSVITLVFRMKSTDENRSPGAQRMLNHRADDF